LTEKYFPFSARKAKNQRAFYKNPMHNPKRRKSRIPRKPTGE
jgi:hypothetical protein